MSYAKIIQSSNSLATKCAGDFFAFFFVLHVLFDFHLQCHGIFFGVRLRQTLAYGPGGSIDKPLAATGTPGFKRKPDGQIARQVTWTKPTPTQNPKTLDTKEAYLAKVRFVQSLVFFLLRKNIMTIFAIKS